MTIKVDQTKCIGCGRCSEICASTFRLNSQGKSEVISTEKSDCAMQAADECPVEAIFVEE